MTRPVVFAVPGPLDARTGGTIYDMAVIAALRAAGRSVVPLELPAGFPLPGPRDMAAALAALAAVPPDAALVVDGLAWGALDTAGLAAIRAPVVAMTHHPLGLETGLSPTDAALLLARERANLRQAARVVVPSPHTGRLLAADFGVPPSRITVALPGFDRLSRRAPVPKADPPLILAVGLLAPRKGHDVLIAALHRILHLPWQAVIAGGAEAPGMAAALKEAAAPLGPRLRFAGRLDRAALQALFAQAHIFALATRYEGYGMVFAEALQHGLPIVACHTGAVPETVPPDAGLLVPVEDPAAFAAALSRLLQDRSLHSRMAAAAASAGDALPGWEATARVFAGALDAL